MIRPVDSGQGKVIHVLTGCTASGKTEVAVEWAERVGAEIISCDSLLFYRGMDIGTAKPGAAERRRVPHHLIDIAGLDEPMNVGRYVQLARSAADGIVRRDRRVIVVGGSGFYLKAFFGPVTDTVDVPPEVRSEVEMRLKASCVSALVEELRRLNPTGLGGLDTANPRRVARALERCLASGLTLAELAENFKSQAAPFEGWTVKVIEIVRTPEDLDRRIAARTRAMLAAGLVDEVRRLLGAGLKRNPSAARAIGYREVIEMSEGRLAPSGLESAIIRATKGLVKKQKTWFRTQLPPHELASPSHEPPEGWF